MLVLAAKADHHEHHDHHHKEEKIPEKIPAEKIEPKSKVAKDPKELPKKTPIRPLLVNKPPRKRLPPPPRDPRVHKLKNVVQTGGQKVHKVHKKIPVLPPRKSRRISPLKKQKQQKRRRVLQKVPNPKIHTHQKVQHVQHKRPQRVNNFSRFLRAFGRQLNRPVLPRFVQPKPQPQTRRKFKVPKGLVHPLVFTKAETIPGYEKFTLDEVIYPEKKVEAVEVSYISGRFWSISVDFGRFC